MNNIIEHFGIRGQRWGVRKYQNPDGSLTPRGAARLEAKDEKWVRTKGEKIKEKDMQMLKCFMEKAQELGENY